MALEEPAIAFVSELQLIVDFMKEKDLLDDDDDFEKELATISLEVSLSLCVFEHRTLGRPTIAKFNKETDKCNVKLTVKSFSYGKHEIFKLSFKITFIFYKKFLVLRYV